MSTSLPPKPNLEHLRKQAKTLLDDFETGDPLAINRFKIQQITGVPKLADAQHVVAREYGFESWPKLKEHVEAAEMASTMAEVRDAFHKDDAAAVRQILERYPQLKRRINDPIGDFDSPIVMHVRSRAMLDVLLDAGADINARSKWWAGSFGLLDTASPELAEYAIARGADITVHAAARLGMFDQLKAMIERDASLVHARGGDGQTPLHFASSIEIAGYLLDRGADIDARDVDHVSTPAQYMVRKRQAIAQYLISRGAKTDILMAAALGDLGIVRRILDLDPEAIRVRVSEEYFPMVGDGSRTGGTIYQWELGWHVSACQVARAFQHHDVFGFLMERSPDDEKLLNACWLHDEAAVREFLARRPALADTLAPAGRRQLAHAARNNDTIAARLMLSAGLPVDGFSQHHATVLHWASWHGNAELVRLILKKQPLLENDDNEYKGTPLNWAIHGSENGWYRDKGDYAATVELLLGAGAKPPEKAAGTDAVRAVLSKHGIQ
jgi:ankyrin repeat protein